MTYTFRELNLEPPYQSVNAYRYARSDDFCAMAKLHNEIFKNTDASYEWFDWYLNLATYSGTGLKTRVYGAFHGKELVGMWCVEPKKLNNNGMTTINVGRAFATGIHEAHRGGGLFTDLSKFAIQSECERRQYAWIFGFPQEGRAVIGAHLKSGWRKVQNIEARGYVPSKQSWNVPLSSVRVNAWDTVRHSRPYLFSFDETPEYKRMRWHRHPEHVYTTLMSKDSTLTLKAYGSVWHILDLQGDREDVADLIRAAQSLAYRHKATEMTIWCAQNEYHYGQIIDVCGFDRKAVGTPSIELLAVPIAATETEKALNHVTSHFQMGVEEIY